MQLLQDKVAIVAGGTRGAGRGIATELGAAGAIVYVTGRSTRTQRSDYDRPETIEETAELVTQAGGKGIAVQVDHLDPEQVRSLIVRVEQEQGRLDILVNDIGAEHFAEFDNPIWEVDLDRGLRLLRSTIETHLITSHFALPLLIQNPGGFVVELTDGTADYNNGHYRQALIYDVAKNAIIRMAWALAQELQPHGCTAVCLTPGWLRSEMMLDSFGVSEANWQDAAVKEPHFIVSETPHFVGRAVAHLAVDPEVARWNGQSLSSGQLAKVYGFTDLDGSQPDAWRYIQEVTEMGKPADATGYR
ncbi:MAG: SDR family oxidoreductase [Leptolyngbya sp. UWPOB_LEPTO1]|uniref:SDR family oxidoreductase n=1 Tax=Leptolyngbya sp. UWPOB_LEPTO1 TaxID=2815653 RepID=UPI001AD166E9|nr:SDR family oxidoreductase [Leptolyngbya sp. UWPOB_LEPTO1]MBN8564204.1 SDR family oxidoreductase [Leptolyngbya sp. UWPOB_LEPTO1]